MPTSSAVPETVAGTTPRARSGGSAATAAPTSSQGAGQTCCGGPSGPPVSEPHHYRRCSLAPAWVARDLLRWWRAGPAPLAPGRERRSSAAPPFSVHSGDYGNAGVTTPHGTHGGRPTKSSKTTVCRRRQTAVSLSGKWRGSCSAMWPVARRTWRSTILSRRGIPIRNGSSILDGCRSSRQRCLASPYL